MLSTCVLLTHIWKISTWDVHWPGMARNIWVVYVLHWLSLCCLCSVCVTLCVAVIWIFVIVWECMYICISITCFFVSSLWDSLYVMCALPLWENAYLWTFCETDFYPDHLHPWHAYVRENRKLPFNSMCVVKYTCGRKREITGVEVSVLYLKDSHFY